MSLLRLMLIVLVLATSVVLALTNPTTDQYLSFVQAELAKAMDTRTGGNGGQKYLSPA